MKPHFKLVRPENVRVGDTIVDTPASEFSREASLDSGCEHPETFKVTRITNNKGMYKFRWQGLLWVVIGFDDYVLVEVPR